MMEFAIIRSAAYSTSSEILSAWHKSFGNETVASKEIKYDHRSSAGLLRGYTDAVYLPLVA